MLLLPSGCGNDGDGVTYTVSFYTGTKTTTYEEIEIEKDKKVPRPTNDPVLEGYIFVGWYSDIACTQKWDFNKNKVEGHTKLFAKWEKAENVGEETPAEPETPTE